MSVGNYKAGKRYTDGEGNIVICMAVTGCLYLKHCPDCKGKVIWEPDNAGFDTCGRFCGSEIYDEA